MCYESIQRQCFLVTGAAGGIGNVIAGRFRAEGVRVAVADRCTDGIDAHAHLPGDLTDSAYCDSFIGAAVLALGGLDILVNNAGVITRGPVTATSDEDFRLSLAVNVEAPFRLCRAAIPVMAQKGGGVIVNTASCWGLHPGPGGIGLALCLGGTLSFCIGNQVSQGLSIGSINLLLPSSCHSKIPTTRVFQQ